jgi:hypothetical protein
MDDVHSRIRAHDVNHPNVPIALSTPLNQHFALAVALRIGPPRGTDHPFRLSNRHAMSGRVIRFHSFHLKSAFTAINYIV